MNHNLRKKYFQFLLPSILTNVAASLNQFVDSIVVANLLGAGAMTMVNMANPLMTAISTIYILLGSGGASTYASLKGKLEKDTAASVFSMIMLLSLATGILYLLLGSLFHNSVVNFLAGGLALDESFSAYVAVLVCSAPFIIVLQVLILFLPADGLPYYSTIINFITNATNLIFDYVYITFFHMGLKGAAFATLTGYIVGILTVLYLMFRKKIHLTFGHVSKEVFSDWYKPVSMGIAPALGQFGFCVKVAFSNYMAVILAGSIGVTAFAACYQTISFTAILLGGMVAAMLPLTAMLNGQKDYHRLELLMKNIMQLEMCISALIFICFELFPAEILALFNVTDTQTLNLGITAIRVFSFMYLFRQAVVLFMYYFQVIGRKIYAVIISLLDGFIGIMILCAVFHFLMGMGILSLWLSYPVCAFLMLLGILAFNIFQQKKSHNSLHGIFLLPAMPKDIPIIDVSLPGEEKDVAEFAEALESFFLSHNIEAGKSNMAVVACEEICAYSIAKNKKKPIEIDATIRIDKETITMSFRSIGAAFDLKTAPEEKTFSNIEVLLKIAQEVRYDYIMGMNYTQIIL